MPCRTSIVEDAAELEEAGWTGSPFPPPLVSPLLRFGSFGAYHKKKEKAEMSEETLFRDGKIWHAQEKTG